MFTIKSFIKWLKKHDNTVKTIRTYTYAFYIDGGANSTAVAADNDNPHRQIGETNMMTIRYLHIGKSLRDCVCRLFFSVCYSVHVNKHNKISGPR